MARERWAGRERDLRKRGFLGVGTERGGWPAAVLGAAALAVCLTLCPAGSFYSTDSGVNYLLARRLAEGGRSLSLDLPAGSLGGARLPDDTTALRGMNGHLPPHMFLSRREPGWAVTYPPLLAALSAPALRLFGDRGLELLPAVAGLGTAWIAARLLAGCGASAGSTLLFVLLGTPMLFYSVVFWGHSLAAFLVMAGLWSWLRGRAVLAGVLTALAVAIRTETLAILAAFPVAVLFAEARTLQTIRKLATWGAGAGGVLGVLGLFNLWALGSPMGIHAAAVLPAARSGGDISTLTSLTRLGSNLWHYLGANHRMAWDLNLLVIGLLLGACAAAAVPAGRLRATLLALAATGGVLGLAFALAVPGQYAPGLLFVMPAAALAPLGFRERWQEPSRFWRLLAGFVAADLLIVASIAPPGGWQWGPRYLLPIVPLVALAALQAWRQAPRTTLLLVVCSLGMQVASVRDLRGQLQAQDWLAGQVAGKAPIVTDVWFLTWQMLPTFWDRAVVYAGSAEELSGRLRALEARGAETAWLVSGQWRDEQQKSVPGASYAAAIAAAGWHASREGACAFPTGDRVGLWRVRKSSPGGAAAASQPRR